MTKDLKIRAVKKNIRTKVLLKTSSPSLVAAF